MRKSGHLVLYQSILQALQGQGCPFCRLLKEFQADRLQKCTETALNHLCNFHAWGLAAVQDAALAARMFLKLVNEASPLSDEAHACDICTQICTEEDLRVREFLSCVERPEIVRWLRTGGILCIPHGLKVRSRLPPTWVPRIDALMDSYRRQLNADLVHLRDEQLPESNRPGWGVVGRAAEFLVANRGLRP